VFYNLYIKREWLTSNTARAVFIASAIFEIFLLVAAVVFIMLTIAVEEASLTNSPHLAMIVRYSIFPGVLGTAILWVGMWYFWFIFHPAEKISSSLWFFVLWLGPPGALVYFFCVYLRSPLLDGKSQHRVATATSAN
jgi:hypothetical protein